MSISSIFNWVSILMIAIAGILLFYMIVAEGELGGLPMILLVGGIICQVWLRFFGGKKFGAN